MAVTTKHNKTSVLTCQDDSPSFPFLSGGHGDTVGVVSNHLEKGGQEGLSNLTAPQERDADGVGLCPHHHEKPDEDVVYRPLLDYYAISARKATPRLDDNGSRRVRRFYQRYFTGVGVGGRLRILSLTSSDEAISQGYDIHRHFRALVLRLRRRWGSFEYIGVKEVKGDRQHLHLVFRGEYMEQVQLSAMWQDIHKSPVVDIRAVYRAKGGARYLAKYLTKEAFNRYWASYNWVFAGWVGWSKRVKRAVGAYPSKGLLRSLAIQDKVKRRLAMDFLEWQYPALWQARLDEVNQGRLCG
ncbi:hypothetical protein ES708_18883 [subsurface metagenome]